LSLIPNAAAALVAVLQGVPTQAQGFTSPPSGDTVGYWQQRVHYTITATLDERAQRVRARGTLTYVNNSPDTLREMFVHQYLNAFRPASKWSQEDEREGIDRFQHLEEPDYGYERFTAPVQVNGAAVRVEYPGAPDSTVVRFALPAPLRPGDSTIIDFQWDARPSALPRRQGRRGRHWDLAQWYPKVAVYDRGGWQANALQPAGEFYGEFGTYDVTLFVANDQVVAATGVPVSGDPGWSRVIRAGSTRPASRAYGDVGATPPAPAGYRAVRFFARGVHHFAWTASTDYRYEGGAYVRPAPPTRFRTWDTVSIHVLWRTGDDTTWGGQRVLDRTYNAMRWLETIYGPYAYPQMTVVHRLDRGGTEFPMMQMNGSHSQGLILHEGGHVWTYGVLANNEWRSGWMDEGLTSYQTAWAQLLTPAERQRAGIVDSVPRLRGYRRHAVRMALPRYEVVNVNMARLDLEEKAQPIGTTAHHFRDFDTYNDMIYDRAEVMYGQLRDVLGDSLFVAFLRDYYGRWAFRHVDERAMRASAERVSGRNLGWFFDQWVHRTGVTDYRLGRARTRRDTSGWVTTVPVRRVGKGEYAHPVPVGVRTDSGWTFARMKEPYRDEVLTIRTMLEPREIRLDPYHLTWDWDRRNDVSRRWWNAGPTKYGFAWPFLEQANRDSVVRMYRPALWYSDPGGVAIGFSERSNYLGFADREASEIGWYLGDNGGWYPQLWTSFDNGRRPRLSLILGIVDGIYFTELGGPRERVAEVRSRVFDFGFTFASPLGSLFDDDSRPLVPELWSADSATIELKAGAAWQRGSPSGSYWFLRPNVVSGTWLDVGAYTKGEVALGRVQMLGESERAAIRLYGGATTGDVPPQRAVFLSTKDPMSTMGNHWWRPRGAILKRPNVNWLPLGGPALRGFHWSEAAERAWGANVELSRKLGTLGSRPDTAGVWLTVFADAAAIPGNDVLYDAGPGITIRGKLYDLPINLRFDFPIYVSDPARAIDRGHAGRDSFAPRWSISFNDIW
jgi:hypothetical protein